MRSSISRATASRSPCGAYWKPGSIGPRPSWYFGWAVADTLPIVRPWKPPVKVMILYRCPFVRSRTSLIAASLASVPELQKKACPPKDRSERSLAHSPCCSMYHVLGTWTSFATCS